jgi:hypothetical protein
MFNRKKSNAKIAANGQKTLTKKKPAEQAPEKKKKNVKKIDGVLWALDANGNPTKKVRKKGAKLDPEETAPENKPPPPAPLTSNESTPGKKNKKNVQEIDGGLWLMDANGNPAKKIRRKGEKAQRRKSSGFAEDEGKGRGRNTGIAEDRRRTQSLGRGQEKQRRRSSIAPEPPGQLQRHSSKVLRKEYLDVKGRKVVVEEDGSKTVIDKTGKRLRKKKKPVIVVDDDSVYSDAVGGENFLESLKQSTRGSGLFDNLWDDGTSLAPESPTRKIQSSPEKAPRKSLSDLGGILEGSSSHERGDVEPAKDAETQHTGDDSRISNSLSAKISEYGKENRELQLRLLTTEEEIQDLTEQNKKEKSKNVKSLTDMMQLKADFTEASSELQTLRCKVKDLHATIDGKDTQIEDLQNSAEQALQHDQVRKTIRKSKEWMVWAAMDQDARRVERRTQKSRTCLLKIGLCKGSWNLKRLLHSTT